MPEMENGRVSITLKDVYQQTQGLEKTLAESMSTLNLTMMSIKSHLEKIDDRNVAADQLHSEHSQRITSMETTLNKADLVTRLPDHEMRIRSVERFKFTLLGALILINAIAVLVEAFVMHLH